MTQRFTLVLNAFMAGAYDTTSQASEAKCREIAVRMYPNDPTMQKHIYEQQLEAMNFMATVTDAEVKGIVLRKYPNDYTMQKCIYEQQLVAKNSMAEVTKSRPAPTRPVQAPPPWTPAQTRPVEVNQAEEKSDGSAPAANMSGFAIIIIILGIIGFLMALGGSSSSQQEEPPPKKSYLEELRKIDDPDKADQYARDNMRALLEEGYENYRRRQEKLGK